MSQITHEHPTRRVLRLRWRRLLGLAALMLVVAVAAAAVSLRASDEAEVGPALSPAAADTPSSAPGVRYDGGPEEGSRGPSTAPPLAGERPDGGPDEGTRGPFSRG
ncbi:MAG: hypothetical protein ACRDL4_19690 [Thermoleophilaceae bacterium]